MTRAGHLFMSKYLQHRGTGPRWEHSRRWWGWRRPNWSLAGQSWEPGPPGEVPPVSWRQSGIWEVCCSCWRITSLWWTYDSVLSSSAPESDSQPAGDIKSYRGQGQLDWAKIDWPEQRLREFPWCRRGRQTGGHQVRPPERPQWSELCWRWGGVRGRVCWESSQRGSGWREGYISLWLRTGNMKGLFLSQVTKVDHYHGNIHSMQCHQWKGAVQSKAKTGRKEVYSIFQGIRIKFGYFE